MTKLFRMLFAIAVASATALAQAQAPADAPAAPQAPAQQNAAAPAAEKSAIEAKVAGCIGCHGIQGYQASFPEVYKVPKIAGQSAKYIAVSLMEYKQGNRRHPTMRAVAAALSDQDISEMAAYFEALGKDASKPLPTAVDKTPEPKIAALLQKAACVSCHGANLATPIDPSYPKIAGQHADYMFVALKAYKTDNNPTVGRVNGVMGAIAKQFSNAELKALSAYVASLPGDLKTVPDRKFR
jgi:cytochrome c553